MRVDSQKTNIGVQQREHLYIGGQDIYWWLTARRLVYTRSTASRLVYRGLTSKDIHRGFASKRLTGSTAIRLIYSGSTARRLVYTRSTARRLTYRGSTAKHLYIEG